MKYKLKLTLLIAAVWILIYFPINYITQFRTTYNVGFTFENSIPFISFFVIFYIATYIIVLSPYLIIKDNQEFKKAAKAYIALTVTSGIVYLIFPVEFLRPEILQNGFFANIVEYLYTVVKPFNALPSLHASLTTLTVLITTKYNKVFGLSLIPLWILILLSTLFIKMHYILDLIAGILLAITVYYWFFMKDSNKSL